MVEKFITIVKLKRHQFSTGRFSWVLRVRNKEKGKKVLVYIAINLRAT
jgi:hypothetical protein